MSDVAAPADEKLAGLVAAADFEADEQIREGYDVAVAAHLQEVLDLTDAQMADLLGRSRRTYTRYRSEGKRLGLPESERLYRYLRLLQLARDVFGYEDKAAWWMNEPNVALGNRTPVEMALTAPGGVVVEELLVGMLHGFVL